MSEKHREPEVPKEEVPSGRNVSMALQGFTSKELAITHFCEKWHPSRMLVSYKTKSGFAGLGKKCSYAHRQVDEQPTKRSKKNDDKKCSSYAVEG